MAAPQVADFSDALISGPWRHTFIPANGSRFHVALAGPESPKAPLVVLLHGFGQFWWTWRYQIPLLVEAGYRVAALDMRGSAASDKPPVGYDTPTQTRDVAGVIRSLGHNQAVVVGHGTGGQVAWAMGAMQPAVTVGIAALSSPHPARLHTRAVQLLTPAALRFLAFMQLPVLPEQRLQNTDLLQRVLDTGAAKPFDRQVVATYREVLRIPFAAHTAAEGLRWVARSAPRTDGRRFTTAMRRPLSLPVLHAAGLQDGFLRREQIDIDAGAFTRRLRFEVLEHVGHYLPEEAPIAVSDLLLDWLASF